MNTIIGFSLNVLCLSLVFALIGSVLWPIICKLLRVAPWSTSIDAVFIITAASIFIMIRDYGHILSDRVNKARSASKWRKSVG